MDNFLKETKEQLTVSEKKICFVMGNESCDLDSAMCAICLSFFYSFSASARDHIKNINWDLYEMIMPLFNITKEDLLIKTEVVYFLKENKINLDHIICRDEVDPERLKDATFILVDHHVPKINYDLIEIIDHRPIDENVMAKIKLEASDCVVNIQEVGSCASLIALAIFNYYHKIHNPIKDPKIIEIFTLLYGPIVLDTVNFDPEADRAKETDVKMKVLIEFICDFSETYRYLIFQNLVNERKNISALSVYQLSSKDLKIINGPVHILALPGYPLLIQDIIKLPEAAADIIKFGEKQNCDCIFMMGMNINDSSLVQRDIAVIDIKNPDLFNSICETITDLREPHLKLKQHTACTFLNGKFYHQNNIKVTRKILLPILQNLLK